MSDDNTRKKGIDAKRSHWKRKGAQGVVRGVTHILIESSSVDEALDYLRKLDAALGGDEPEEKARVPSDQPYRVGDFVVLRPDLAAIEGLAHGIDVTKAMVQYAGETVRISYVALTTTRTIARYRVVSPDTDAQAWGWEHSTIAHAVPSSGES